MQPTASASFLLIGKLPKWNKAEVGTIEFKEAGPQLLTFDVSRNNFAYFDFEPVDEKSKP